MSLRGIREKVFVVMNPFPKPPDGVVWSERFFAELGPRTERGDRQPIRGVSMAREFSMLACTWRYSGGTDVEQIHLAEGEHFELREREARSFLRDLGPLGYCMLEKSDESYVQSELQKAVSRSIDYYLNQKRGMDKVYDLQGVQGDNDTQLSRQRSVHWIYYVNEAVGQMLTEYRDDGMSEDFGSRWFAALPEDFRSRWLGSRVRSRARKSAAA